MYPRILAIPLAGIFILLIACQEKTKPPEQTTGQKPTMAAPAAQAPAADTTLPSQYLARAETFAKAETYDSAIVYFKKAGAFYEARADWEKRLHCYNQIGDQHRKKGEYDPARQYLEKTLALGLEKLGEQHLEVARSYYYLGILDRTVNRFDQALASQEKALAIRLARLGEQHPEVALSYLRIGNVYSSRGEYDRALALYEKCLSIQLATLGEQHTDVGLCYEQLGWIYKNKGDYDRAFDLRQKSLSIYLARLGEGHRGLVDIYYAISADHEMKGEYDKSLEFAQKALSILSANQADNSISAADNYLGIGNIYYYKTEYEQARIYYEKALSLYLNILGEQNRLVGDTYDNLGITWAVLGDYDKALSFHYKALSIYTALVGDRHDRIGITYGFIGNVYVTKGDHDRGLQAYAKALSILRLALGAQHPFVSNILQNLGTTFLKKGDDASALAYYKKALTNYRARFETLHPKLAAISNRIGVLYYEKDDFDQALRFFQDALTANVLHFDSHDPYLNPPLRGILDEGAFSFSLSWKASTLADRYAKQSRDLRDLKASLSTSELLVRFNDNVRTGFKTESAKLAYVNWSISDYDNAIQSARWLYRATQQTGLLVAAFEFAEKSKAGIMLEALTEAEAKRFAGIPDSLLEREQQLRLDLTFYDKTLAEEKLKGEAGDSAKIALWQDKVFRLKHAYDNLLQGFEKEYPDYYNLKYQAKTVSVAEVQQVLDDNTALLEYFVGADTLSIFVITPDAFTVTAVAKDSAFEQHIAQLRRGITEQDYARYTQPAYRLYQLLVEPVADKLKAKKLIIVPDAVLSEVPFEALLTEQRANGKLQDYGKLPYLVNGHAISYAYSATLLQQQLKKQRTPSKRDYLAFAPVFAEGLPAGTRGAEFFKQNIAADSAQIATRVRGYLPSTKREVAGILQQFENRYGWFERWFSSKARVYLEKEAKEANLKLAGLGDYRYVHFATHGLVNEKNPKLSGLLLAQEDTTSNEDGILHLGEIYNLNLNADLVVLSACETGLGQVAKGEGIIGLTRGFLYAGASNLLVSLWQVSDVTTADLMVDFYDKMLGGMSKPEALRGAKLQMIRRHAEYAKPYYWAPFILVGK